ncbi:hypothetical protein DL240_05650 [Lujinxingia litoralis]|uniref:Uncharacterized protein n=1 Tax=Lujinxingia litoralis TaxID=2211119 RepID=A0A328C9H5_9DELT|nr:hypothetical protein [Lujinxingia litoralis]RAL23644.1 hypothetical protein DL240_05650 [Lujinxingia litoralis]
MADPRADIARTIARLDHPDAIHQNELLAHLSTHGDEAVEAALASLGLLNPRVHRALLRWLNGRLTPKHALPLMRYIFDAATRIEEQSGRTLAMAMLERLVDDQAEYDSGLRGRARAFAEDLLSDRDPDIVRAALAILMTTGDGRSALKIESARAHLEALAPEVLPRVLAALDGLSVRGEAPATPDSFAASLLRAAGPRRRLLVREWRRRDDRRDIALAILSKGHGPIDEALQILIGSPCPQARAVLGDYLLSADATRLTLTLRALASIATPPASPAERAALRSALPHPDSLVREAAAALAEGLQLDDAAVERALLGMLLESDALLSLAAARALAAVPGPLTPSAFGKLVRAADMLAGRWPAGGSQEEDERAALGLAWTLRAAARRLPEALRPDAQEHLAMRGLAIVALNQGLGGAPTVIASLELLDALSTGAPEPWPEDQLVGLIRLGQNAEAKIARRAARVLLKVAPEALEGLDGVAENDSLDTLSLQIPLLERSRSEEAIKRLQSLSEHPDVDISEAAHDALARQRHARNQAEFIEAEFIPHKRSSPRDE